MKYISFSFDDGRADTYSIAMPIMKKYGILGTVNIISDYVIHPKDNCFESSPRCMSTDQVLEWQKWGGEIASHGRTHKNSTEEIEKSIEELASIGVNVEKIGFASPESWLTDLNSESSGIDGLLRNGTVSYLRSGIQVRREGILYTVLSIVEQFTHSNLLYYYLNRKNIIKARMKIYSSAAVKNYTTVKQIKCIVNHVGDNEGLILMFHSVLSPLDSSYGKDHYYWDIARFEELCKWLSAKQDVLMVTTRELIASFGV